MKDKEKIIQYYPESIWNTNEFSWNVKDKNFTVEMSYLDVIAGNRKLKQVIYLRSTKSDNIVAYRFKKSVYNKDNELLYHEFHFKDSIEEFPNLKDSKIIIFND